MVQLKKISIGELKSFIDSNDFCYSNGIPITPLRAFSQIANPTADSDDIALTVAISDDGQLQGYVGSLPTKIGNTKCAWNSGWWVREGASAQVSMKLLGSFIADWNKKVLFSEMTPHTAQLIDRLGFCKPKTEIGFRGYYRFCTAIVLPRKHKSIRHFVPFLRIADAIFNVFINAISVKSHTPKKSDLLEIDESNLLTEDCMAFIRKHNSKQPDKRNVSVFNWISSYPWLTTDKKDTDIDQAYFFSYHVNSFESKWLKFTKEGEIVGLINYVNRDHELKIPYAYINSEATTMIGEHLYERLQLNRKLSVISLFDEELVRYFNQNHRFVKRINLPKYTAVSKTLIDELNIDDFRLQMGDGDAVFT